MEKTDSRKVFKAGETILKQGEAGDSAYIIEEGKVEIKFKDAEGRERVLGTRGANAMIGEMAIIDNAPRTATIVALEDCKLLEITQHDFSRRLESADSVLKMATQVILTRYRDTLTRAEIWGERYQWPPAEMVELSYVEKADAVQTITIANEFKDALLTKFVQLYYQPIISLKTGEITGFEALMRWNHPKKGFISPAIFIPVAEESGLIIEASKWALREACHALKRIEAAVGMERKLYMSVNFSSADFSSDDFVTNVYNTISESDVAPEQVHLEITERVLIQQPDRAKDTLRMCRKAGMGIAIDDFGTGYSSLSYLHYFPIDTLKIDQTFVRDMHKNEHSLALVNSIVTLGQNMHMTTVAEGVEVREEAHKLREMGCELAQGYLFAKPMSESDLIALLTHWTPFRF
ncbi:MAG: EAL domain-containing protein [Alphaproteobacteria bacterium]|mgnify:CR=1 FL=1|nr:EAL domain-containing protein [Alphaproteobacteria bacterium]MBP7759204.1 EAL domain-containing protein [Alphaproteobacteria bacterium]MBP7762597.1 EAL domain-containing protein [Alphaproteobacteria bacterium]MBP7905102.1 EAL domain-containing protein [Alphaproteobacteria bacterium]